MKEYRGSELRAHLTQLLEVGGVRAVLEFLNGRTPHRFTGLYRLDPPMLRNIQIYDSENPQLEIGEDAPLRETYCSIVGRTASPFQTGDARSDDRLASHPAREATVSYFGVPLRASGAPLGTLCHFDVRPQPAPESELELMETAASLIARFLADSDALAGRQA